MVRLSVILLGTEFVRKRWPTLAFLGALWAVIGALIFIDALDGVTYFPLHVFGYLLLAEAVFVLLLPISQTNKRSLLSKIRGVCFLLLGLLIVDSHHAASIILAVVFGVIFLSDGFFRIAAAVVVRFRGWQFSLLAGIFEIAFALFILEPYPTLYVGTVPICIGMNILMSGCVLVQQSFRLKDGSENIAELPIGKSALQTPNANVLVIHIWTPNGAEKQEFGGNPLLNRYIAAVDKNGVVSAGHAAIECGADIYISHYPDEDIDRNTNDFVRLLRATPNNDVAGRFLPSYPSEVADWCPSTIQIKFMIYNLERLNSFWNTYRLNPTYNLTSRNCSSAVALCLEAALDGTMSHGRSNMYDFFRVIINPEFWLAAQIRKRANAMAWTPGLVLDYARALNAAIESPPLTWFGLCANAKRACIYIEDALRGRQPHTLDPSTSRSEKSSDNK
ncbi:HdeD family acid-resistance protein [Pseudomonas antarctica]|uniref:HdeD family acid-resistance protein n=1 Tax=Pseudomonas antarctica TaxID=219572 RepID=UPI00387B7537